MHRDLFELTELAELDNVLSQSAARLQLIFKHSTTCPISTAAYRELEKHLESGLMGIDYSMIIVQHARNISNEVATRLGVKHESPQAILVRNGRAVWNASHYDITDKTLSNAIKENL